MSAHGQDLIFGEGRRVVTELGPTRYERAAAGFGCHAEHVVEPGDLKGALARAFASGVPACVNVMTDPSVISPITVAMVGGARPPAPPDAEAGGTVQIPYYADLED
jgi:acetolactate synthase-1/2/3 large subunit